MEIEKLWINRIYHPYWLWEETKFNMWGRVHDRQKYLDEAIVFTGDHEKYGSYMLRVAKEWPYSCEHNLTGNWQNEKAWIGHAACALAFQCPEDIVRQAWGYLTEEQQWKANNQADIAISYWKRNYAKNIS